MRGLLGTIRRLNQEWLEYEYKHTTLAIFALYLFVLFFDSALVTGALRFVDSLGYIGALVAGVFTVSFFTAAPAAVVLIQLGGELDPVVVAILGGIGGMIGDWLLLSLFEEQIFTELQPLLIRLGLGRTIRILRRRRHTSWLLVILGAVVILTPFPDEAGIALLGIAHFRARYLLVLTFILNAIGILGIILAARFVIR